VPRFEREEAADGVVIEGDDLESAEIVNRRVLERASEASCRWARENAGTRGARTARVR